MVRDRFENGETINSDIILKVSHSKNGRKNQIGPSNEVVGIQVGDEEEINENGDIIIDNVNGGLEHITNPHPKLMALQYPLLYPTGEDSFHNELYFEDTEETKGKTRQKFTFKYFHIYKLRVRHNEGMRLS